VIEWLKEELAQHRRPAPAPAPAPTPELFAPVAAAPAAAKRKAAPEGGTVKAEADANDKRSWMSSAQLWSCGSHDASSTATANGGAAAKPSRKVGNGTDTEETMAAPLFSAERDFAQEIMCLHSLGFNS
jgi:hypothetical protein